MDLQRTRTPTNLDAAYRDVIAAVVPADAAKVRIAMVTYGPPRGRHQSWITDLVPVESLHREHEGLATYLCGIEDPCFELSFLMADGQWKHAVARFPSLRRSFRVFRAGTDEVVAERDSEEAAVRQAERHSRLDGGDHDVRVSYEVRQPGSDVWGPADVHPLTATVA